MKKIISVLSATNVILHFLITIAGFLLHALTSFIAFSTEGFLSGILAFCMPVISTIFVAINMWISNGFLNFFTVSCLIYAAVFLLMLGLSFLINYLEDKQSNQNYIEVQTEETKKENEKMKNTIAICITIIICLAILCFTIYYTNKDVSLSAGEQEALEYIQEKADYMGITVGEYIQLVKEYEAEQNAMREYFEKVENGTNTRLDDLKAEQNGWLTD